jgi:outer membrane protein assembly factor BamB
MKKSFVIILTVLCQFTFAQVQQSWNADLGGQILWQEVTPLGNLIVCTDRSLQGLDPETGKYLWSLGDFGGLPRENYQNLMNSPLFSITRGEYFYMINPFNGDIVFNSDQAGIENLQYQDVLYRSNGVLIAGEEHGSKKPVMMMIDLSSGAILWSKDEKFGKIVAVNELSPEAFLMVTLFYNYKIESASGNVLWKNATSEETAQLENMGAFGNLMKNMAESMAEDMNIEMRFYRHPEQNIFVLATQQEKTTGMTSSTSVYYENTYYAYNISDGSMLWKKPITMNGLIGELVFQGDQLIILPDDGNRTKINMYDLKSQEGKWGKKGNGISIKGGVYNYIPTERGLLLVTRTGTSDFLNVLDPSLGLMTFDKPVKVDGTVVGVVNVPKGLLYITSEEVNILDPATGSLLLEKSIHTQPALTAEAQDKIYAFDTREDMIKVIDKTSGTVSVLSKSEINFEGKEIPRGIELREQGIFIFSDQNVAMIDYEGNLKFQNYFPAPRESGLKRALMYAQAVRAAYIGANSYYACAQLKQVEDQVKAEDPVSGALVEGFGTVYGQLGDAATDFAVQTFRQANARFKATAEGRNFLIVLSRMNNENLLIRVNKDNGKMEGSIDLGKDRQPEYAVDDVTGQVYLKTSVAEVVSYQL